MTLSVVNKRDGWRRGDINSQNGKPVDRDRAIPSVRMYPVDKKIGQMRHK